MSRQVAGDVFDIYDMHINVEMEYCTKETFRDLILTNQKLKFLTTLY